MRRSGDLFPVRREQDWGFTPWSDATLFGPANFVNASPWQTMRRVQEDMDRLFSQFLGGAPAPEGQPASSSAGQVQRWAPSVDVSLTDQEWLIEADLPGVSRENLDVFVQNRHLVIRAELKQEQTSEAGPQRQYQRRERRYGYFERVFPLPQNVDENGIRCDLRDGVLKVHVPRTADPRAQVRRIPVGESGVEAEAKSISAELPAEPQAETREGREPALAGGRNGKSK